MTNTPELSRTQAIVLFLAGVVAVGGLLFSVYGDRRDSELSVGEPSPVTFAAPVDLDVIDEVGTAQQRLAVRAQIAEIYHIDRQAQQLVLAAITSAALPEDVLVTLLEDFTQPEGVRASQLPAIIDSAVSAYPDDEAATLRALLARRLLPTSIPDQNLTEAARNAAASAIPPVLESIPAGQPIVREGETLSANQLSLLQATGLYDAQADDFRQGAVIIAGSLLLGGLFALALMLVWRFMAPNVSARQFLFLGTLTLVVFIAQRYALGISQNFIFIMLLPLITSILVSRTVAMAWAAWSAVLLALLVPAGPEFALVAGLVGSAAAAWFAPLQRSRTSLLLAGAFVIINGTAAARGWLRGMHVGGDASWGTVAFPLALMVVLPFTWSPERVHALQIAFLVLAVADPLAAMVGERWPVMGARIGSATKSLGGSATFLFASFLLTLAGLVVLTPGGGDLPLTHSVLVASLAAVVATAVEALAAIESKTGSSSRPGLSGRPRCSIAINVPRHSPR